MFGKTPWHLLTYLWIWWTVVATLEVQPARLMPSHEYFSTALVEVIIPEKGHMSWVMSWGWVKDHLYYCNTIQDGAPKIAKLVYKPWFMVDITIVNGDYFMVYKPTNITGGPHPVQTGGHPFFSQLFWCSQTGEKDIRFGPWIFSSCDIGDRGLGHLSSHIWSWLPCGWYGTLADEIEICGWDGNQLTSLGP